MDLPASPSLVNITTDTSSCGQSPSLTMATQTVSSVTSAASNGVDAGLLRNAIRLVHCLQKEKGSSCAFYADNKLFEASMLEARSASDISSALIQHKDLPIKSSLVKIRNLIETHKNPQDSDDTMVLHRIFVCFNTLISYVLHECILNQIHAGIENHLWNSTIQNRHRRGLSIEINDRLSSATTLTSDLVNNPKKLSTVPSMDDVDSSQSGKPPLSPFHEDGPVEAMSAAEKIPVNKRKVNFSQTTPKIRQLLDLLHIFVQLKESAGTERAILSSLLALRGTDDASMGFLMNDLILQVENQRNLVQQLKNLPEDQHRNLVLELGNLSPRLEELQTIILSDYESLRHAEYDADAIWDLITQYVDKLHSVELLLVEEVECCSPVTIPKSTSASALSTLLITPPSPGRIDELSISSAMDQDNLLRQVLQHVFLPSVGENVESTIESLSPDQVKHRLLEVLQKDKIKENKSGQVDMQSADNHQHAAALNLNEDMNRALGEPAKPSTSKEWEISIYELKFTRRIGVGAAATTYLADWTGQQVAVKVASASNFGLEGWRTEVDALQRLHHPNIIRLLGSVYHENPLTYCLVLEYCNAGDLATVLKYPTPKNFFFKVSLSVANAMGYLHSRHVIHRDLKPANVLCDGNIASGNFTVKVTDFGVSTDVKDISSNGSGGKMQSDNRKNLTGETGTYRWMAPEVIRHESYSTMADVFSFAIMLWQFITHEEPYADVSATDAARLSGLEKQRPPIPSGTPKDVVELIKANWADQPNERMAFDVISDKLKKIQDNLTQPEREFLENNNGHPVYEYEEVIIEEEAEKKPSSKDRRRRRSSKHGDASENRRGSYLSSFFGSKKSERKARGQAS